MTARFLLPFLAAALSAFAQEGWPEGHGQRWERVVDGWLWGPEAGAHRLALHGRRADDGEVDLAPGQWWFAEAGGYASFRVTVADGGSPPGAALEIYSVTRGTIDVGPQPRHIGAPPARAGLLAERLPWTERGAELRAELGPGQNPDWVAVRCVSPRVQAVRFALDGYGFVRPAESWERLERAVRDSSAPGWPVPLDPETLPGTDVGRHLRAQRILLPWEPLEDSLAERRLRAQSWCAADLLAREPVRDHVRTRNWDDSGIPGYRDDLGRSWLRSRRLEREVQGPCVLRVSARLAWPERVGDDGRHLSVRIAVGDRVASLTGWPGADVEETSRLWDWADLPFGDRNAERWLISAPREIRLLVPPGTRRVRLEAGSEMFLLVQELHPIEPFDHPRPPGRLHHAPGTGSRWAAAASVALELAGRDREALGVLSAATPVEPLEEGDFPPVPRDVTLSGWFLWRRLLIALRIQDQGEADAVVPRLLRSVPGLRGDLAAEARLALLRYARETRRDGMARQIAQWIFDDPPAEPEDFVEALSAWCTGRRPLERMRAWPVTADPRVLRRFLADVEARSIREVFGTWADLGTVGATAGGRRWVIPVRGQVNERPLRADAWSAWMNLRSQSGAGPWYVSGAESLDAVTTTRGYLQVVPAADWVAPLPLDLQGAAGPLGRIGFRDAHALGLISFEAADRLYARPSRGGQASYLWRGQNVVFGAAAGKDSANPSRLRELRLTGEVAEGWGLLTELFPLSAPAGSMPSLDFRGEDYERAGLVRYRFGIARSAAASGDDLDVPFTVSVGGEPLPGRRLLWISASREPQPRDSGLPPVESWAPGPMVTGFVLVGPGPALVRVECPRRWNAWASAAELDVASTPGGLLVERSAGSTRVLPPSGLWAPPLGVTGEPSEAEAVAAATRAVLEAPDATTRAAALEARARLLWTMGRSQAVKDLLEAELLLPEGSFDRDRVSTALAVVSFRVGNDLELRARVEAAIRGGGRSRELFFLAAAAALGTDDLTGARQWYRLACGEAEDGSGDLERFVAVALDEVPPPGVPADPLLAVMIDLLRLRRLDPATQVRPSLEQLAERCDAEAREAAARRLFSRGARFAAWALEARELAPWAGTVNWPPPRGILAPLERARDLRNEEVISTPPKVRLAGRFGAWGTVWMTAGDELLLELPGPEVYELEWRSAHEVRDGVVHPDAAPARMRILGLPGPATRAILASEPAPATTCERLPWAWPGRADAWRVLAQPGTHRVSIRLQSGGGFLAVRRLVGPVWLAWDTRTSGNPAPAVVPPPPLAFAPDPSAAVVPDIHRRLNEARKAMQSPRFGTPADAEALIALADDLLYAVLTRADGAEPEWVVRALDLFLRAHADGLGSAHWQVHSDMARLLSRWTVVDLSADLPEFRRVRIPQDLPDDPAVAVSNALFYPTRDDLSSVLFDSEDVVTWHRRDAGELPLRLEVVAATDPPIPGPVRVVIGRDGQPWGGGVVAQGEWTEFDAGRAAESMVTVRVFCENPLIRVRARVRLLVETGTGWEAVKPERRTALHQAPAGRRSFAVRGPTLARLEIWAPEDLAPTEDPAVWLARPAPIARTFLSGVARAGAGEAEFEIPGDSFVRLAVRTVDGAALARAVSPPVPRGDLAAEAVAPPAPDRIPAPREGEREQWRLVEYPGILELNFAGALRHAGEFRDGDNADVDEIRSGARLHWKPFEAPFYARFSLEARRASTYPVLVGAEIRANYTFSTRPDLSARVLVQGWVENLHGYTGYSYETDARLRWRQVLDEQWILFVAASMNSWWSSLGDRRAVSAEPHPLIHNDYRDDHDRWLAADVRLRAIPWQNVRIDMRAGTRTNRSLLPWDPDRWTYGVDVQAHHEDFFAEFSVVRILRIDDDHRSRRTSSRVAALDLAWETWLGRGTWMSAGVGFSYDFDDHEREVRASLAFRFGGRDGTRHEHIDPELQRFERYQEARFPWRQ